MIARDVLRLYGAPVAEPPEPPPAPLPPAEPEPGPTSQHAPIARVTRRVQPQVAAALLGVASWAYGAFALRPSSIGDYGLLGSANPWFLLGLAFLVAAFLLELRRRDPRGWLLGLVLVGLIVAIHSSVPIIFGAPEFAWVYKHVGITAAFQRYGHITDPANIYQQWPVLFAAVAALSSLAHVSPASLATWAPLTFELADALLLAALFRLLTDDRRIVWLALLLFEGFIAWVGQDYLSPQAFGYLLWLAMAWIILRWLRSPVAPAAPPAAPAGRGARGRVARLRASLIAGMPPPRETTKAMRATAVVLAGTIFFAIVAAHQLTPYIALAAVGVLTLLDLIRPRWLLVALAAVAGGYLALHYSLIAQQFGGLFSGGNPFQNASGAHGTPNASGGALTSAHAVDALILAMWLSTSVIVARRLRRPGPVLIPAVMAFSPFLILGAQSYGGEAIYRVYMFSAPWCALLIAGALFKLPRRLRWPLIAAVSAAVLCAGLEGLYGPLLVNGFTRQELSASVWMYRHLPSGAAIVLPVDNFPTLESADYNRYSVEVMPADPQFGSAWMNEGNVSQVETWIVNLHLPTVYVVVSHSMDTWAEYYGAPAGYRELVRDLPTVLHGQVIYHDGATTIYRLGLGVRSPSPPAPQPQLRKTPPARLPSRSVRVRSAGRRDRAASRAGLRGRHHPSTETGHGKRHVR